MAGKWTQLFDVERNKWVDVYIEFPPALKVGAASGTGKGNAPSLLGADGRPLPPPVKRVGFKP